MVSPHRAELRRRVAVKVVAVRPKSAAVVVTQASMRPTYAASLGVAVAYLKQHPHTQPCLRLDCGITSQALPARDDVFRSPVHTTHLLVLAGRPRGLFGFYQQKHQL